MSNENLNKISYSGICLNLYDPAIGGQTVTSIPRHWKSVLYACKHVDADQNHQNVENVVEVTGQVFITDFQEIFYDSNVSNEALDAQELEHFGELEHFEDS